jgi:sensor histidine kinase YesM
VNKSLLRNIITTAVTTSLVLSLLIVLPLFIIGYKTNYSLIAVWTSVFVRFLLLWIIDLLLFYFVEKKWTKTWLRIIVSSSILIGLDILTSYIFGDFFPIPMINRTQLFFMRFSQLLIFNILIFILINLIFSKENELKISKDIADLKFSNLEAEYLLLKQQINPHFIFNALNISKSLIKNNPKDAEKFIIKLSAFIRTSIDFDKKSSSLLEELNICRNYIDLQKVRFGNSLVFRENIDKNFQNLHLPFFSLITLLENAFKHNLLTEESPIFVSVSIEKDFVVVTNNIQPKIDTNSTHTGLKNLNRRSKLLSGNEIIVMKNEYEFTVKIKLCKI